MSIFPEGVLLTDCKSLFEHLYSLTSKTSEMLLPDFAELREAAIPWRSALSEEYREGNIEVWWIDAVHQLADNLTKLRTPSTDEFFKVIYDQILSLGTKWQRPKLPQRSLAFVAESLFVFWCENVKNPEAHPDSS